MTDSEYVPTAATADDWVDAFVDCGAEALCEIRCDWDREKALIQAENRQLQVDLDALLAPLRERIAKLEGQLETLTSLLAGDTTNNPARSKHLRQQRDNGHLLEAPRQ